MGQEFVIKSQALEDKINQLLPSQGGFQAGVDLSASTQIVPIVDLTESAEGSQVRQDLQTAFGYNNSNVIDVGNVIRQPLITTTGYYKVKGNCIIQSSTSTTNTASFTLYDGTTYKTLIEWRTYDTSNVISETFPFDYTVFLSAGKSLAVSAASTAVVTGSFRQIADVNGNLTPLT